MHTRLYIYTLYTHNPSGFQSDYVASGRHSGAFLGDLWEPMGPPWSHWSTCGVRFAPCGGLSMFLDTCWPPFSDLGAPTWGPWVPKGVQIGAPSCIYIRIASISILWFKTWEMGGPSDLGRLAHFFMVFVCFSWASGPRSIPGLCWARLAWAGLLICVAQGSLGEVEPFDQLLLFIWGPFRARRWFFQKIVKSAKSGLGQSNLFTTFLFLLGCWTSVGPEEYETTLWLLLIVFRRCGHVCPGVVSSTIIAMTFVFQSLARHRKLRCRPEAYQRHPMLAWGSYLFLFLLEGATAGCVHKTHGFLRKIVSDYYFYFFFSWRGSSFCLVCITMTISISFFGACMKLKSQVEPTTNYFYSFPRWPLAGSMTIQRIVIGRTIALPGCIYIYIILLIIYMINIIIIYYVIYILLLYILYYILLYIIIYYVYIFVRFF